jgi:CRP-like cAMP-binding protein
LDDKLAVIAMIEVSAATLAARPFLHGVSPDHLAVLARAASDVTFPAGRRFFADGGHASCFWLVQSGHVTVDVDVPGQGRVPIGTIGMGELMGWSWLFPPFMRAFGAVAASPVETFEFDARTVRAKCASGPAPGFEVTRRVAEFLTKRLKSTRSRLITVLSSQQGHAGKPVKWAIPALLSRAARRMMRQSIWLSGGDDRAIRRYKRTPSSAGLC